MVYIYMNIIIFCRFQELDLSKEAYFTESSREEDWMTAVTLSLPHRPHQYVMVSDVNLGYMLS